MKTNRGFTLIELVIVLALTGIIISMIFSPIIFSLVNFKAQNEKTNITSDLRTTMDYLTRQIRKADIIETINDNSIKIDGDIYKIENANLTQNGKIVKENINELIINKSDVEIKIGIVIIDTKGVEHELYSNINIR